jgi:hypothetical protein
MTDRQNGGEANPEPIDHGTGWKGEISTAGTLDGQSIAEFGTNLSGNLTSSGIACPQGATFLRRCGGSAFRNEGRNAAT